MIRRKQLWLAAFCLMVSLSFLPAERAQAKINGWETVEGNKYYFKRGKKLLGLQQIRGESYYFRLKDGRMLRSRWRKINNSYYYFGKDGRMLKSRWVRGYYVNSVGERVKNCWVDKKFIGEDGKKIKNFRGGWYNIGGNWYYYTKKGVKKTGWIRYKGQRYYLNQDGIRLMRMQTINNKNYYFTKKGVLRSSRWVKSGKWYYYANQKGVLNMKERMNAASIADATVIEYNSATLKVKLRKYQSYGTVFWLARVQTASVSQMKAALSYGTYGGTRQRTSEAVLANGAVLGINGSAFSYESGKPGFDAVMLKNGKIYNRALGTSYSLMAISMDGTMFSPAQGLSAAELKKGGVRDTFNFGPILLKNGAAASLYDQGYPQVYAGADMTGPYPRAAVGMVRPGEYILLVSNAPGLTLQQMRVIFKNQGCVFAYNLDGGGSSTLAYQGHVLNRPTDGSERPCGDFLLFSE